MKILRAFGLSLILLTPIAAAASPAVRAACCPGPCCPNCPFCPSGLHA